LEPSRGRRVLIGLSGPGQATLMLGFSEAVCRAIVSEGRGQDPLDLDEGEMNAIILAEAERILERTVQKLRKNGAEVHATPAVIMRSTVAIATSQSVERQAAEIHTGPGAVSLGLLCGPADGAAPTSKVARKQIALIVDDEPSARRLMCKIISDMGLEVESAESGEVAIAAMGRSSFDVVLLDYEMPGMDGVACLEQIRQLHPGCRVIMVTAAREADVVKRALGGGAVGYVLKPYNPASVKERITKLLKPEAVGVC